MGCFFYSSPTLIMQVITTKKERIIIDFKIKIKIKKILKNRNKLVEYRIDPANHKATKKKKNTHKKCKKNLKWLHYLVQLCRVAYKKKLNYENTKFCLLFIFIKKEKHGHSLCSFRALILYCTLRNSSGSCFREERIAKSQTMIIQYFMSVPKRNYDFLWLYIIK